MTVVNLSLPSFTSSIVQTPLCKDKYEAAPGLYMIPDSIILLIKIFLFNMSWCSGKCLSYVMNYLIISDVMFILQAGPYDNLKDVSLKILQSRVSTVPIIHSSSEDGSFSQLLHLASLSGILKCK